MMIIEWVKTAISLIRLWMLQPERIHQSGEGVDEENSLEIEEIEKK